MRKSSANVAKEFGNAVAINMFLTMLNPKYRGKAFNWHKFVELAERHAEVSCYTCFPVEFFEKHEAKLKKIAVEAANKTANECLQNSGILEWFTEEQAK